MTEDVTNALFKKIERFLSAQDQLFTGLPKSAVMPPSAEELEHIQQRLHLLEQEIEVYFDYEAPSVSSTVNNQHIPITETTGEEHLETKLVEEESPVGEAILFPEYEIESETTDSNLTELEETESNRYENERVEVISEDHTALPFDEEIYVDKVADEADNTDEIQDESFEEVSDSDTILLDEEIEEIAEITTENLTETPVEPDEEIQAEVLGDSIDEGEQSAFFRSEEKATVTEIAESNSEKVEEKPYVDPLQFDLFGPPPTPVASKGKKKIEKPAVTAPSLFDELFTTNSTEQAEVNYAKENTVRYADQKVDAVSNNDSELHIHDSNPTISKVEKSETSALPLQPKVDQNHTDSTEQQSESLPPQATTEEIQSDRLIPAQTENVTQTAESFTVSALTHLPVMLVPESVQLELNQCTTLEELRLLCEKHKAILQTDLPNTNLVFGVGNPQATLMIVGEAPGENEDIKGEPFVGKAGQLLDKILEAIQLSRNEVYIANILKHRPPQNRDPLPEERERSLPFLIRQIELIQPKLILCLGRISARTLLGLPEKVTLAELRGKFHPFLNGRIEVTATYHPASLLRNPNWKRPTWEDMKMVRKRYDELG